MKFIGMKPTFSTIEKRWLLPIPIIMMYVSWYTAWIWAIGFDGFLFATFIPPVTAFIVFIVIVD